MALLLSLDVMLRHNTWYFCRDPARSLRIKQHSRERSRATALTVSAPEGCLSRVFLFCEIISYLEQLSKSFPLLVTKIIPIQVLESTLSVVKIPTPPK